MITRRGFLGAILAAAAAPAIVRADSLMKVAPRDTLVLGESGSVTYLNGELVGQLGEIKRFTIHPSHFHEIWSESLNKKFYEAHQFHDIVMTEYVGPSMHEILAAQEALDRQPVPMIGRLIYHPS